MLLFQNGETNAQSTDVEKKPIDADNTTVHSLLSVKQDFSNIDFSDNSNQLSEQSCGQVLSEFDEDAEADVSADVCDVADITTDEADSAKPVELNSDDDLQCERLNDKRQPHESCDLLSNRIQSHTELDESGGSLSGHADNDEFCAASSDHDETAVESDQLSDVKSKKASLKRMPAEHTSSADDSHTSPVAKKLRRKTCAPEMSSSQLVKTASGTFVVHDITEPGEMFQSVSS